MAEKLIRGPQNGRQRVDKQRRAAGDRGPDAGAKRRENTHAVLRYGQPGEDSPGRTRFGVGE